jgi:hypothetical protein
VPKPKAAFLPNYFGELADRICHCGPVDRAVVMERPESNGEIIHIKDAFDVQMEVLVL